MAKKKSAKVAGTTRRRQKWPDRADFKPWLECLLDVSERHPETARAAILSCIRLKQLAECGDAAGALRRLQRFLDKLPDDECEATGFLALKGAEICFDLPDPRRAEKFIRLVEAREPIAVPRVRTALQIRLRKLRAANGLTEPSEGSSPGKNDALHRLGKSRSAYREALLAGDEAAAAKALQKAAKLVPTVDDFIARPSWTASTIGAFVRLGDDSGLAKYVTFLDRNRHSADLATGTLWGMGLHDLANKRAENLILSLAKKLKTDPDSNIHFPVNEICNELWFFLQTGQKETAEKLLRRILRELPNWPGVRGGFATAGVLTELAELLAEIDGPEAALELLGLAVQAGQAEKHRGFRKGALKAAKQQIDAPGLATAIAKAGAIKNARSRREALIPLLVRRAYWSALATLLDEISDVEELRDSLDTVVYKLPGGSRLM